MSDKAISVLCKSGAYELSEQLLAAHRTLYPSADAEFARMLLWLERHPARRPASPKSAPRFVANWFKRVPRVQHHNPAREQRAATIAALTGRTGSADVIDMPTTAHRVGRADFRADDACLWRAEGVDDVGGAGPAGRQVGMG